MLMWLRKLEVLNKVATSGKLNFVLGEKGLAERVVNLRCMNPLPGARKRFRPPGFLLVPDQPRCLPARRAVRLPHGPHEIAGPLEGIVAGWPERLPNQPFNVKCCWNNPGVCPPIMRHLGITSPGI